MYEVVNHPGADVRLVNARTGEAVDIQLKATDSATYLREHQGRYPDVEVYATEEVASSADVASSGFRNSELVGDVNATLDEAKRRWRQRAWGRSRERHPVGSHKRSLGPAGRANGPRGRAPRARGHGHWRRIGSATRVAGGMSGQARSPSLECLRLFRGMAVPSERAGDITAEIKAKGLAADRGRWRMIWDPPGEQAASDDEDPLAVCACGDFDGAAYYASKQNRHDVDDTPLVVEFECDIARVAVDGRDFLYTVFQMGSGARTRDLVGRAFGRRALTYLDAAWRSTEQSRRIELCREARHDPLVVRAHYSNPLVLGGRHGTRFRSAFLVRAPVPGALMTEIRRVGDGWIGPEPEVRLDDALRQWQS